MYLAVDAMGGDHAPAAILDGSILALNQDPELFLYFCGKEDVIKAHLADKTYDQSRVEIVPADEIVGNDEHPVEAVRRKKNASVVVALNLVKDGKAQGAVSAGSTGAFLAGSTFIVKRIRGIQRPALAPLMPRMDGKEVLLIDCGANVDCRPQFLPQFALMGSAYMEKVMGVKNPKVGLLNNGAEEGKGNELTKEAYPLLQQCGVNFGGNAEARDIVTADFDVVVSDGFAGNIALKSSEGIGVMLFSLLKKEMTRNLRSKIGALLLKPALKNLMKYADYTSYGGAILLGVNAPVVKGHGSSNAKAFCAAVHQTAKMVRMDVVGTIKAAMENIKGEDA
ncbi:MAG: phosphate acyltransferase PlsX [Clostridiales bacterium]|nr:phosphate acyltransferase PlsX [Clostridiales bacterium]